MNQKLFSKNRLLIFQEDILFLFLIL